MTIRLPHFVAIIVVAALCTMCLALAIPKTRMIVTPQVLRQKGSTWDFSYRYPKVTVPGALMGVSGMIRDFNGRLQQDAQNSLADFKKQLAEWSKDGGNLPKDLPPSDRSVTYTILTRDQSLISVKFEQYQMMRGAAHPVTTVITRNFLWGAFIKITTLFTPKSNWLQTLSHLVGADLQAQAKAHGFDLMSPEGYGPQEPNFEAFGITKNGLVIYLQRDQVAAGAVGNLKVLVPWRALDAVLDPNVKNQIKAL